MTYEEIVAKVKNEFGSADVSNYEGHLALQINITGEGSGIFYAEINEGQLFIEPYDYKNNDAVLIADGNDMINILNGTLDPVKAFNEHKLNVEGDLTKALSIIPIIENNKKAPKKRRTTSKAATTEKAAEKTPVKASKATKAAEKVSKTASKAAEKVTEKISKVAEKAVEKAAEKTTKATKTKKTSTKKAEDTPIIGLSDPKSVSSKKTAPKSASKTTKATEKPSTKAVKKTSKTSKNKKG